MQERLQKLIAAAGIASRRGAEELIAAGEVLINGRVAVLGDKADPASDHIKVRGRRINDKLQAQEKVYLLLNKPLGVLTSKSDPNNRPLVVDLVGPYRNKVHPVGRLDFNTEGLLLLTNDGAFTQMIAHASHQVAKVYEVKIKGQPAAALIEKIARGVRIDGARTAPAEIELMEQSETNAWYRVTLREGRNQQIRKMFDSIGHSVLKLRRIAIGFLREERLRPGEYRVLTEAEVKRFIRQAQTPTKQSAPATKKPAASRVTAARSQRPAKRAAKRLPKRLLDKARGKT